MDIALEDGTAFSGDGFQYIKPAFAEHTVHFIGLLSDGGVCLTALFNALFARVQRRPQHIASACTLRDRVLP